MKPNERALQNALNIVETFDVPVFPLRADKSPTCENGFYAATKYETRLRELFAPDAAVLCGVPTGELSGFDVFDVDLQKPEASTWLMASAHLIPPTARIQKTRSGGWHVFFKHHPGLRLSAGNPSKGLDVRADGGYIVWWNTEGHDLLRDGAPDGCAWSAELLEPILAKHSYRGTSQPKRPEDLAPPSVDALLDILRHMPNEADTDRDTYVQVMMATQGAIRGMAALELATPEELERCANVACEWAALWDSPRAPSFEAEREKWDSDFSQRDNDLSGWRQLLGIAHRLGVETAPYRQSDEFEPLMPEVAPNIEVWDPWESYALPAFPIDVLPQWLQPIVLDTADMIGTDVAATALAYLAGIAAGVHGQTRVKVQRHSDWSEAARLWLALVGDPSARKSPLMGKVMSPMQKFQEKAGDAYVAAMEIWEGLDKEEKAKTPKPKMPIYLTHDATPEAIAEALSGFNRGLLMYSDELVAWLGSMERYGGKGGGSARGFWLQTYNGQGYQQHRVGRGYVPVKNMSVSVIGSIQMDRLARLYKDDQLTEDGLLQRFLPILMGPAKLQQDRPPRADHSLYHQHVTELLQAGPCELQLDDEGHRIKEQAFADYQGLAEAGLITKGFSSWLGKGTGFLMRLAVALHFAEQPASQDRVIAPATVAKAVKLMEFIKANAALFYKELSGNRDLEDTKAIAGWILLRPETEFTLRHFGRGPAVCRKKNPQEIKSMLSYLVSAGWLIPETNLPTNNKWTLQPGIREALKHRADEVRQRNDQVMELIREATAKKAA